MENFLLTLQPTFKAGEISLTVDMNTEEYKFLKTTRIDDLLILPYAGYLVIFSND